MPFDKNKIQLVPIVVLDIANMLTEGNLNHIQKENYIERLEVTRNFIDTILSKIAKKAA